MAVLKVQIELVCRTTDCKAPPRIVETDMKPDMKCEECGGTSLFIKKIRCAKCSEWFYPNRATPRGRIRKRCPDCGGSTYEKVWEHDDYDSERKTYDQRIRDGFRMLKAGDGSIEPQMD